MNEDEKWLEELTEAYRLQAETIDPNDPWFNDYSQEEEHIGNYFTP